MVNLAFSHTTDSNRSLGSWSNLYTSFQSTQNTQLTESSIPILRSQIGSINFLTSGQHLPSSNLPSEFPLQIHTSRISFYFAFLNHLISLLLLISRPRNIDPTTIGKCRTTTWHAVQICGLSMSNNILWSWDPVVIAALLHAGQSLSYGAQQKELLLHLRRLEETTAWKIGGEVDQLVAFWRASS